MVTRSFPKATRLSVSETRLRNSVTFIFFFQAEDGIRDGTVTGVQTCALPILRWHDLLLQQADRTYRDHWAAERKGEPYYRQIGLRYITDAQGLVADKTKPADKDPRLAQARQARERMALRDPVEILGEKQVDWTSESKLPFK